MILIGLGSSLPFCALPPQQVIGAAISAINVFAPVCARSRLFASPAWPDPSDPAFANAVIAVEWGGDPETLLAALHRVEDAFGRIRSAKNAPRTLDLDLLAFNDERRPPGGGLTLPHPALAARDFVLAPLADIAPDWRHPDTGMTPGQMLAALENRTAEPVSG
jgi:2-amino-4-hydroxy-6-hydroxymethyldihydropteridine diphosphokinase